MIGLGTMSLNTYSSMPNYSGAGTAAKPKAVQAYQGSVEAQAKISDKNVDQNSDQKIEKKNTEKNLDHVVATSEFGDTVQVSEEGQARYSLYDTKAATKTGRDATAQLPPMFQEKDIPVGLEESTAEGTAERIPIDQPEESQKVVTESEDKTVAAPTSFAGVSDSQMKELYLKGAISRYDYDRVIEQRKEVRDSEADQKAVLNQQLDSALKKTEDVSRKSDAYKTAFKEDSAAVPDANTRLDMMTKATQTAEDKNAEKNSNRSQQDRNIPGQSEHRRLKIVVA